jgi:hypothetical protein
MAEDLRNRLKKLKKELETRKEASPDVFLEKIRQLDPSLRKLSDLELKAMLRKLIGAD